MGHLPDRIADAAVRHRHPVRPENLPINASGAPTTVLGGIADIKRSYGNAVVSQYDIVPMVQIYATTQGRDLGTVSSEIRRIIKLNEQYKPKGAIVTLAGQTATMYSAYTGLLFGLLGAIVLIYLLIVVNFQSWIDPFVIITALPAALARYRLDAVCDAHDAVRCPRSPARSCAWASRPPTACW